MSAAAEVEAATGLYDYATLSATHRFVAFDPSQIPFIRAFRLVCEAVRLVRQRESLFVVDRREELPPAPAVGDA